MKTIYVLAALILTVTISAGAEDKGKDKGKMEMMKTMQEYGTPGAPHKMLADMAGKWNYTSTWWESADGKPQTSKGKSTLKMILDGHFLQQEFAGKSMGMDFKGMGITGYNNLRKRYETVWLDNMATGIMHGTGTYDEANHVLKDSGEFTCPMNKEKDQAYRTEWKMIDKDNSTFTMWAPGMDGKEYKNMEIAYKRSK